MRLEFLVGAPERRPRAHHIINNREALATNSRSERRVDDSGPGTSHSSETPVRAQ